MENPASQENPFELVPNGNMLVPRVLLSLGREEDLERYREGWNDQRKLRRTGDEIRPGIADNWYDAGASYGWATMDTAVEGSFTGDREQDLSVMMQKMRDNPKTIPHSAWSDEDFGSDRRGDTSPDKKNRY